MKSTVVARGLLLVLGLFLGCTVGELGLRVLRPRAVGLLHQPMIYQRDEQLGYRYLPGARGHLHREFEIDNEVVISSLGFHDVEVRPGKRGPRIVVVGDSFTAGLQVPVGEVWTRVLEAELRRRSDPQVEVVNLGIDGTGTTQQLDLLREYVERLAPDVVLLAFFENDPYDVRHGRVYREEYGDHLLAYRSPEEGAALRRLLDAQRKRTTLRWLHEHLYLVRLALYLEEPRNPFRSNFVGPALLPRSLRDAIPEENPSAPTLEALFRDFRALARQHRFRPIVVALPSQEDPERSAEILREHGPPDGVEVIDPLPLLREAVATSGHEWNDLYWRCDGHWNALGDELFAKALAREIGPRLWASTPSRPADADVSAARP